LRIGTWNVLSLYRPGASNILKQEVEKVRLDLVALQEIRWLGNGTLEKKNCVMFYSCNPVRHVFGVGFYANSRLLSNILHFEPVNDRLCWIRVRGKFRNYSIINAHAPTGDKDDEEKDKFYLELETVYSHWPRHDIKMVLGDFNAKVGKEESNYPYAGRSGLHEECNRNAYKLVQFAAATNMIIGGTIFTHKNIHKVTWRSPDGDTMNQIGHILIQRKHSSNLKDVRCKLGINVDSDHHLVMAEVQARILMNKIHKGQRVSKYNVQSLEKEEVQQAFRSKIME
jgi:endonuclease/exonuclease/phosphatase family metal-dependent hydrolase